MAKLLFLDIDGVLNSMRTCYIGGFPHSFSTEDLKLFDWVAIGMLRKLQDAHDIEFVLSSSWRWGYSAEEVSWGLGLKISSCTPKMNDSGCRGEEIKKYLDNRTDVEAYCIVDDCADMLEDQAEFFVQTDDNDGLSFKDMVKICDILQVDMFKLKGD